MSLDRIKNAILAEAQREAERVREAGRRKAQEKYRLAEEQLRRRLEQRLREAEERQQDLSNRAIVALRSSLSMELLAAKNKIVDKVFDRVADNVINLPSNGYRVLLMKWLKNAAPHEHGQLVLNARDNKAFGQQLLADVNKMRAKEAAMTLADDTAEILGGFILRTTKYEIDRSLDGMIAKLKEEMAPEIASTLFGSRAERVEA